MFLRLVIVIALQGGWLHAAELSASCKTLASTQDLYRCILDSHPHYQAALLSYEVAMASRDQITQLSNPELSIKSISGKNAGENSGSTEVALSFDLTDLFIKRRALSQAGRSEEKFLTVEAQQEEFTSKVQIIRDLYRYRQLFDELDLANEALEAFKKIENQFRARRARGPDQDITLNLVELAQGDYQLKKNHLVVEKFELEAKYKGIFGEKFELKKNWLPSLKVIWPAIELSQISKKTFELQKAEAQQEKSQAEKNIAKADSWPKMKAGPVVERSTDGPTQFNSYGVNLSVSIPIFSQNGGARNLADKNQQKTQLMYEYTLKKEELEKQLLIQKYQSAVESLKKSTSKESLQKKHTQIDGYFKQGLTSGTTVIEAHRQILAFTESQHEHEMVALDTLMSINHLSDKDVGEVLK